MANDSYIVIFSFAGKLLAKTDFDCSREIRCQELLKKRFGEAALHGCEVMVKGTLLGVEISMHACCKSFFSLQCKSVYVSFSMGMRL